ncbi:hypothetical protein KCM76_25185 [Zooshikella marina]|uniref:hypothetical protein n=1 Tax=Zooshikella ganghwensis TaxID=202772 RepID=UPI001BAE8D2C|nr:hypothetical protein [Zooshikella ganghwensis]MBU2709314.1 hypothetical protein [Zooshikella ganghwensis]
MSKLALNIAIGAFLDKSLGKSIKKSQASAAKLGKAYRETNKQLAAVKEFNKYKAKLTELKGKQTTTRQSAHRLAERIKSVEVQYKSATRAVKKYGIALDKSAKAQKKLQRKVALQKFGTKLMPGVGKVAAGLKRGAGFMAGGATAAFGLSAWTANRLDPIAKTADKLGIGIEALQEFQYAAERSGLSVKQFNTGTQRMIRRVAEAAKGTGTAKGALQELGLNAQWLGKLKPEQQLDQVAEALSQVKNQNDRVRLAMKLFDSEGVGMVNMLKDGRKGLQQLRADARATGNVLGEKAARDAENFNDALLDAQMALGGVKNTIGAAMMPAFTQLMKHFKAWVVNFQPKIQAFAKNISSRFKSWAKNVYALGQGFFSVTSVISNFISTTIGWKNLGYILAGLMGVKLFTSIMTFGKAIWSLIPIIKAVGAAFLMNPIGLVITAIAGSAALIITYWEPIKGFFSGVWDSVKGYFTQFWDWTKNIFLSYSPIGILIKNWAPVTNFFSETWDNIKGLFTGAWDLIKGIFNKSPIGMLLKHWKPGFEWLASKFSWIKDIISSVFNWFGDDDEEEEKNNKQKTKPKPKPSSYIAPQHRGRSRGIHYGVKSSGRVMSLAKARNNEMIQDKLRQRRYQQIKIQNQSRTNINAPITIQTQPGQNSEDIAKRVREELKRREFEEESDRRASLYDQDGLTYGY